VVYSGGHRADVVTWWALRFADFETGVAGGEFEFGKEELAVGAFGRPGSWYY
jgi:hypothetical protein